MKRVWWKEAVVYQIYPKSFRDSDGDGIGDLRGVIEKLPYLQELGVGVVWLSPIFASPMIDNGYDISDYKAVNPLFGTIEDVEELCSEAAQRGLRIVFDIALNHASTEHDWFKDALAGGDKRDWFFFRDGEAGAEPNNWRSIFGGPAWTRTGDGAFYLHLFDKTQADLNWEQKAVRDAIYDAMRFWLDKGVGGFRLDVVTQISKPDGLPDLRDPSIGGIFRALADGPRLHDYLREMRREVFDHYDCVAIGEAPGVDPPRAARLVDPSDPMLDMIYHFDLVTPQREPDGAWDRAALKRVFADWDQGIGERGWNSAVLSNHDLGRIVSRFGDDANFWFESATMLLALVLLQRATPFVYQGDEIGMTNNAFRSIQELDDVWAKTTYRLMREGGADESDAFAAALAVTRDHARTPMLWTNAESGGFSTARPWMRSLDPRPGRDAEAQASADTSVLAFAKRLIRMRADNRLLVYGAFKDLSPDHPDLYLFERSMEGRSAVALLNLRGRPISGPSEAPAEAPTLCNYSGPFESDLRPFEARLWLP